MTSTLTRRTFLLVAASFAPALAACAPTGKGGGASGSGAKSRDITLALWSGAADVPAGVAFPKIDTVGGARANRVIRGPIAWTDDRSGRTIQVYERIRRGRKRTKRQLLTPTQDGQGLGRVLDERDGEPTRWFEDDVIFPLGRWRRGEERTFSSVEHTIAGPATRTITLKIRRLDYVFRDVPGSLKYDWTARDAAGRTLFSERYVYSPGKGQVRFRDLLKNAGA